MIEIKGKYNTAKVFTNNIEDGAKAQILELLNQEFIEGSKVRIMPDTHSGIGCVIGFTADLGDKVIPNLVGVDIGCSMITIELGKIDIDLKRLDEIINRHIPVGIGVHKTKIAEFPKLQDLYCYRELRDTKRMERSIGTLGSGNHFIEVNVDSKENKYLVIHTGSRNLGHQVATFYQKLAIKLSSSGKSKYPKDLSYLTGKYKEEYLHDMKICQEYAGLNRETIANIILDKMFGKKLSDFSHFHTVHNYINFKDNIIRKGAVSAYEGEKLLIPINMRDGSILAVGKGNPDWNYSAPHGAGRLMSRRKAKESLDLNEFKAEMKDIYSTSVGKSTLDEAPMAYKPIDEIIGNIKDTVDIIEVIKPIYNFKA